MLKDFTKEKFDILIQAGQSNSEGIGYGLTDEPFIPDERIWYLNANMTISLAAETVYAHEAQSNFSLSFARRYVADGKLKNGRKLLILRCAVGGTGFLDNRWKPEDDLYLHMMEMIRTALELNPENRLVALLWHQGESDAICGASYDVHYRHLSTLVNNVRGEFNAAELPFIAGDFVADWKRENAAICAPVVDAIRAVCRNLPYAAFVETEDLLSNRQANEKLPHGWDDNIHFCRDACYRLGERYFGAFCLLLK